MSHTAQDLLYFDGCSYFFNRQKGAAVSNTEVQSTSSYPFFWAEDKHLVCIVLLEHYTTQSRPGPADNTEPMMDTLFTHNDR